jgi:hypothetical protein
MPAAVIRPREAPGIVPEEEARAQPERQVAAEGVPDELHDVAEQAPYYRPS